MPIRIIFLLLFIAESMICSGQKAKYCVNFPAFKQYISTIFEDTTHHWSEYPTPPKLTDKLLLNMQEEIMGDDSAILYIDHLSFKNFKWVIDYEKAISYLNKMDDEYVLLALAAHWNPDLRVNALLVLNKKWTLRPMTNSKRMKNGAQKKFDYVAIDYLIYLLEGNPLFINGSENATIHEYYISLILWNLDLLTGEHIVTQQHFRDWYKNDLQLETAVIKWKTHLK